VLESVRPSTSIVGAGDSGNGSSEGTEATGTGRVVGALLIAGFDRMADANVYVSSALITNTEIMRRRAGNLALPITSVISKQKINYNKVQKL
jgi:hypothetical protein